MSIKLLCTCILLSLSLYGCSPSPDDVKSLVKQSVQQGLQSDDYFSQFNMIVGDVDLVNVQGNQYKAFTEVFYDGEPHTVPIDVLVKKELNQLTVYPEIKPGAFGFIATKELGEALHQFNTDMDKLDTQISNWDAEANQNMYNSTYSSSEAVDVSPEYISSEPELDNVNDIFKE